MIAHVLINRNIDELNREFSYIIPSNMEVEVGSRVIVPFGRGDSTVFAIVTDISSTDDLNEEDRSKLKEIKELVDIEPLIGGEELEIADYIAKSTFSNKIEAIKLFLPPASLGQIKRILVDANSGVRLNENDYSREYIKESIKDGKFKYIYRTSEPKTFTKDILVAVNRDDILTKKQLDAYNLIKSGQFTKKEIMIKLNISNSPIDTLIKKGLVEIKTIKVDHEIQKKDIYNKHELNTEQKKVKDGILSDYKSGKNNKFLLNGITGSGKTEVYLQIVEEILKMGKSAIILVPEIGLTPQTVQRFKGRFEEEIAIIHSRLTMKERYNEWTKIKDGEVKIVVGARSAIFSPVKDLGIIIIDEEHDNSYVSSKTPKYRTVDIATFRADQMDAMMLLGSATPSIDSYYKAEIGEYKLYELKERANMMPLPKIEVVDMANELKNGNTSIFSLPLYEAIRKNLEDGKQSMIFLNRRGFSGFISCRTCGESIKCEDCDVSMTYHRQEGRLICHYCGRTKMIPQKCPICGSTKIKDFSIGTEQVELITRKLFPMARIARMDRDTTSKRNSHYKIWKSMNDGDIDILIGTQMIAKGLDFKDVTLVGILAADMTLKLPDFRSTEWTYSIIRQVAGRSGRGNDAGRVILQTYQPQHYAIQFSVDGNYEDFFKRELRIRREFIYPPFSKMILVQIKNKENIVASRDLIEVHDKLQEYMLENKMKSIVLYPNPSPISKIKNEFRWQFVIKALDSECENIILFLKRFESKELNVSVDPISMM